VVRDGTRGDWGLSERVGRRLRQADTAQILLVYLCAATVVLLIAWPAQNLDPNDSWFFLVQTRVALTAFICLNYGAALVGQPRREGVAFMLTLLGLVLLTIPLEGIAFVGSFPSVPLWWSSLVQVLVIPAYFTLGLILGWSLARLRLSVLTPLLAALLLVGAFFLDLWLGFGLVNPIMAAVNVSPGHLVFCLFLLALYLMMVVRGYKYHTSRPKA
jgi:hypothetical protein